MARVNIQYSVDLSELADEVGRLYKKAITNLKKCAQESPVKTSDILAPNSLEKIDTMRNELAIIDTILLDVENIITGYIQHQAAEQTQRLQPPSPTQTEEMEIPQLQLSDEALALQQKLAAFKESLEEEPDEISP